MLQIRFRLGLRPQTSMGRPRWGAYSAAPDPGLTYVSHHRHHRPASGKQPISWTIDAVGLRENFHGK